MASLDIGPWDTQLKKKKKQRKIRRKGQRTRITIPLVKGITGKLWGIPAKPLIPVQLSLYQIPVLTLSHTSIAGFPRDRFFDLGRKLQDTRGIKKYGRGNHELNQRGSKRPLICSEIPKHPVISKIQRPFQELR